MTAARHNLTIEQGSTFELHLQYLAADGTTPINLTGATVRMQVRLEPGSAHTLVDIDSSADPAVDGVTVGTLDETGAIDITLVDEVTSALDFDLAVYDLTVEDTGGVVKRLLEGTVHLDTGVTKIPPPPAGP